MEKEKRKDFVDALLTYGAIFGILFYVLYKVANDGKPNILVWSCVMLTIFQSRKWRQKLDREKGEAQKK